MLHELSQMTRAQRLKSRVLDAPYTVCIERARYWTESHKATEGMHPSLRAAKALEHTLRNVSINILDEELIVGNRSSAILGTILPIERGELNFVLEWDLNSVTKRKDRPFQISRRDRKELLTEILPYWKGRTIRDLRKKRWNNPATRARLNLAPGVSFKRFSSFDMADLLKKWYPVISLRPGYLLKGGEELVFNNPGLIMDVFDVQGHLCMGHARIIRCGLKSVAQEAQSRLADIKAAGGDANAEAFLESVVISCEAARDFAARYSKLADKMAESENDPQRAAELRRIAGHCRRVPWEPPRTFREAVQFLWLVQTAALIAYGMGSYLSVGRVDQFLHPFYADDLANGSITREEATELAEELLIKLSCNLLLLPPLAKATAGELGGDIQAITIGGVGRDGRDATNELSMIFLDAARNMRCMSNSLSVRIDRDTPDEFMMKLMEVFSCTSGPAVYNDDAVIEAMIQCGHSIEDARDYVIIGCVEPTSEGNTFGCTSGNDVSLVGALEMALNRGKLRFMGRQMGPDTGDPCDFERFEDVVEAFRRQVEFCVGVVAEGIAVKDEVYAEICHCPFVSATLEGCVDKAKEMTRGGAKYNFGAINAMGFGTVADSLASIRKFVFEEKRFTMREMMEMLETNYRGHERERCLLAERGPKYGRDDDEADGIAALVMDIFCKAVSSHNIARGGTLRPGFFSYGMHVYQGMIMGATPDGRKAGQSLSNSLSPSNGVETGGLTAMLRSVSKLGSELVGNGYSVNARVTPKAFESEQGRRKMADLLRTYFSLGGMHIQPNVVTTGTLRAAQESPDEYKDLVVRISGYCGYFTDQGRLVQEDIISRTEFERG
ncbi:MAG TPA: pyruvate formate lyase family protein [Candidatus Brocadiia bacterium]|nr:pyruvate formate lyase family protein [Candidatus Brocadiia bacterium]